VGASGLVTRAENYTRVLLLKAPIEICFRFATFSIETLGYCALMQWLMMMQCVSSMYGVYTFARDVIL